MSAAEYPVPPVRFDVPASLVGASGSLVFVRRSYQADGTVIPGTGEKFEPTGLARGDRIVEDDGTVLVIGGFYRVWGVTDETAELVLAETLPCAAFDWCEGHDVLEVLEGAPTTHSLPTATVTQFDVQTLTAGVVPLVLNVDFELDTSTGTEFYGLYFDAEVFVNLDTLSQMGAQLCEAGEALRAWAEARR